MVTKETLSVPLETIQIVCKRFETALFEAGISAQQLSCPKLADCSLREGQKQQDVLAEWVNNDGIRFAYVVFKSSGAIYGELDVYLPHPEKPNKSLDVIELWGTKEHLVCEPILISN